MKRAPHPPRSSGSEDIELVSYGGDVVVAGRDPRGDLFRVEPTVQASVRHDWGVLRRLAIIDSELGSKKV